MTSSVIVWAFTLLFISMLKICSVLAAEGRSRNRGENVRQADRDISRSKAELENVTSNQNRDHLPER